MRCVSRGGGEKGGGNCVILGTIAVPGLESWKTCSLDACCWGWLCYKGLYLLHFTSTPRWTFFSCRRVGCESLTGLACHVGCHSLLYQVPREATPSQMALQSSLACSQQPTSEWLSWRPIIPFLMFVRHLLGSFLHHLGMLYNKHFLFSSGWEGHFWLWHFIAILFIQLESKMHFENWGFLSKWLLKAYYCQFLLGMLCWRLGGILTCVYVCMC